MKQHFAIGAGILVSVCLFVPIMELTDPNDYNLFVTDQATGLSRYTPNSTFVTAGDCYENKVAVNNLGFHGPFVSPTKGDNVFRIIVIGSSYASAIQVPIEEMYSTILEKKLNENSDHRYTYEVIPIALGQNRTLLDMFYYLKYGSVLSPDIVINIESEYELTANNKIDMPILDSKGEIVLQTPKSGESPKVALFRSISRHSKLLVNFYNRVLVFMSSLDAYLSSPFLPKDITIQATDAAAEEAALKGEQARWDIKEKVLRTYSAIVASDGAKFVYASWTSPQVATSTAEEFPRHMNIIAARNDFFYADLVPVFVAEEVVHGKGIYPCDVHWNTRGNSYAASSLYAYLMAHPELLSRIPQ